MLDFGVGFLVVTACGLILLCFVLGCFVVCVEVVTFITLVWCDFSLLCGFMWRVSKVGWVLMFDFILFSWVSGLGL